MLCPTKLILVMTKLAAINSGMTGKLFFDSDSWLKIPAVTKINPETRYCRHNDNSFKLPYSEKNILTHVT